MERRVLKQCLAADLIPIFKLQELLIQAEMDFSPNLWGKEGNMEAKNTYSLEIAFIFQKIGCRTLSAVL